ncbi:hypothetical protein [Legionella spiritensis]|uniref:hypothetical protein n=1 Tax=Legionella spiritensis TaxID=452 RepID=UPI000F70AF43|nr:hypothetical protein [Legionella spiritensis]VEG90275.1 Uncharacterised protein [Legionella spiritensis]
MLTVSRLKEWLADCREKNRIYLAGLPENRKKIEYLENEVFLSILERIITQSRNELVSESHVRDLLKRRARFVVNGDNDFFCHPHHPVNRLFLHIAHALAEPDEPVCTVLNPSLHGLCRQSYSLKSETEDEGFFYPEHFLPCVDNEKLLVPIAEIYEQAELHPEYLFRFSRGKASAPYFLSRYDVNRLAEAGGDAGIRYIKALKETFEFREANNLGHYLEILADELYDASKMGKGTEEEAFKSIAGAVRQFYEIWQQFSVSEDIKELELTGWGRKDLTLNDYLLTLFVPYIDKDLLSDEERRRATDKEVFPCAHQLSCALNEALRRFPQLYCVRLNPDEQTPVQHNLVQLKTEALEAIKNRGRLFHLEPDDNDVFHLIAFLLRDEVLQAEQKSRFISKLTTNFDTFRYFVKKTTKYKIDKPERALEYEKLIADLLRATAPGIAKFTFATLSEVRDFSRIIGYLSCNNQELLIELLRNNWLEIIKKSEFLYVINHSFDDLAIRKQFLLAVAHEMAARTESITDIPVYYEMVRYEDIAAEAYWLQITEKFPEQFGSLDALQATLRTFYSDSVSYGKPLARSLLSALSERLWLWLDNEQTFAAFFQAITPDNYEKTVKWFLERYIEKHEKMDISDVIRWLEKLPVSCHEAIFANDRIKNAMTTWLKQFSSVSQFLEREELHNSLLRQWIFTSYTSELLGLSSKFDDLKCLMSAADSQERQALLLAASTGLKHPYLKCESDIEEFLGWFPESGAWDERKEAVRNAMSRRAELVVLLQGWYDELRHYDCTPDANRKMRVNPLMFSFFESFNPPPEPAFLVMTIRSQIEVWLSSNDFCEQDILSFFTEQCSRSDGVLKTWIKEHVFMQLIPEKMFFEELSIKLEELQEKSSFRPGYLSSRSFGFSSISTRGASEMIETVLDKLKRMTDQKPINFQEIKHFLSSQADEARNRNYLLTAKTLNEMVNLAEKYSERCLLSLQDILHKKASGFRPFSSCRQ